VDARHRVLAAASLWLIAIVALYGPVLAKLGRDLTVDPNYSHGLLVAPLALLLVWQSRERLRSAAPRPSWIGLVIVAGSLALFAAGSLGAELFTTRLSLIGLIAGTIVYAIGWAHLRIVAFPIAFLTGDGEKSFLCVDMLNFEAEQPVEGLDQINGGFLRLAGAGSSDLELVAERITELVKVEQAGAARAFHV